MPTERPVFRDDIHLGHKVPTVDTDDLVNKCVTEPKLDDNAVSERTIQKDAVTEDKIKNDSVTTPKIKDKNVTTPKLQDEAVTEPKIGPNAVTGSKIKDGEVTEPKLHNDAVTTPKMKDGAVTAPKIKDKNVTPEKVSDNFISTLVSPLINALDQKYKAITNELYSMIRSLQVGGLALSDRLGNREDIGITQKEITAVINSLNARIDDITGQYQGLYMTVTPTTFIAEDSGTVNITASAAVGVFDHIAFYLNDVLVSEADQIASYSDSVEISETSEIKCVATILGVEYVKTQTVTKYFPFFLGCGTTLEEALSPENARDYEGTLVGSYDITANEGDKIFMLIPASLQSEFIRLDMNGYEIPFTVEQEGDLVIWESENTYQAGEYNIDITDNNN